MRGLVGLLLTAAVAVGQEQPASHATPQPGSLGWPPQSSPTVPPPQPSGVASTETRSPGSVLPQYPGPTDALIAPVSESPLPGSLDDIATRYVAGRQAFRTCTIYGEVVSFFPETLLWEPPLASKIEPRLQLLGDTFKNTSGGSRSYDTSIGTTAGLARYGPVGHDIDYQLDLFGVVLTRLSPNDLLAADYRFGVPLTARWGAWHVKVGYEHTSAHLGDEFIRSQLVQPTKITAYAKDEVVVGVSRCVGTDWRVYGVVGYAKRQSLPDPDPPLVLAETRSKLRYSGGVEWYDRAVSGSGTPFVAVNLDSRGDQQFKTNYTAQAGWLWRNPFQRLASLRVFGEYYNGRSPYGQFYLTREKFYGVGIAGDF